GVRAQVYHHVEVTRGTAVHARLAFAGQADPVAFVHARGYLHRQRLVLLEAPGPAARCARGRDDLAAAMAARAGLLDRKESLLDAHLPLPLAGGAGGGRGAGLGAGAVARLALLHRRDTDAGLGPARGVFQRDLEVIAQVGPAEHARPAPAAAAEDV